ncbi:hypothetical protein PALB_35280 [Pseudoalteromonas luteoviolacea B = ATCC 29581]|nr:hypothetical protein PALB_35280 [Pseudoalteromonas luteoviolacea B = ATCC 29581]
MCDRIKNNQKNTRQIKNKAYSGGCLKMFDLFVVRESFCFLEV